jgi:hypothetical protein
MGEQVEGVRLSTNPSNAARRRFIPETFHSLSPAARMSMPISDSGQGRNRNFGEMMTCRGHGLGRNV